MQWIPTSSEDGITKGDIFVAFARPSGTAGSSLVLFKDKNYPDWTNFKNSVSLGVAVRAFGKPVPHGPSDYDFYRTLHPEESVKWIFDKEEMPRWSQDRKDNAINPGGGRKPRSAAGVLEAAGKELIEEGYDPKDFRSSD
jgi:hypothetical protein